jgi:hypothetical protein
MVERTAGEHADWSAVDKAMIQAASIARDVAAYRHAKLSAIRLAGETCNLCHTDKTTAWATEALRSWADRLPWQAQ